MYIALDNTQFMSYTISVQQYRQQTTWSINMRQYIGIIYWADGSGVLDNTTTGGMHSVWKQCCKAHRLHSGRITIHKATDSDTVGKPIKEFISVDDCIEKYNREFKHD